MSTSIQTRQYADGPLEAAIYGHVATQSLQISALKRGKLWGRQIVLEEVVDLINSCHTMGDLAREIKRLQIEVKAEIDAGVLDLLEGFKEAS